MADEVFQRGEMRLRDRLRDMVPDLPEDCIRAALAELRADATEDAAACVALRHFVGRLSTELHGAQARSQTLQQDNNALWNITRDLKSSLNELSVLEDLAGFTGSYSSVHDVLSFLLDMLSTILPMDASVVYLIDRSSRDFIAAAARSMVPELRTEIEAHLEEGTFAWAIRQGSPVVLARADGAAGSLVVVPMFVNRNPIGVVGLFTRLAGTDYTPNLFRLLQGLIRRESVTVENAIEHSRLVQESRSLELARDYLDMIVDNMADGLLVIAPDNHVTILNQTAELLFGIAAEAVRGRNYAECLPVSLVETLSTALGRARREEPLVDYEFDFDRGQGVTFRLGVSCTPIKSGSGLRGVICTFRDLFTARELMRLRQDERIKAMALTRFKDSLAEAESRARRSERLASVGQMAAGVAHEINNPLGSIAGFIQIMLMDATQGDENRGFLQAMLKEVHRMKGIVDSLLDFARQQPRESVSLYPFDVNELIAETVAFLRPQITHSRFTVSMELDPRKPVVIGLPDRVKQALINLCLNALHAGNKSDNRLEISTTIEDAADGANVVIRVTDNGSGIRQEDLPRIFDPFFTTRPEGQGTGLGLATCYNVVEQHGGAISVESVWGEGTTFLVSLPVEPPLAKKKPSKKQELS